MSRNNGNGQITDEEVEYKDPDNVPVFTYSDDIEKEFRNFEQTDNARLLVKPGDDIDELMMRANIPSMSINLCLNLSVERCRENGFEDGIKFWRGILAGSTGIRGQRASLFSDTIIGEKHSARRDGFGSKIKQWISGGPGDD